MLSDVYSLSRHDLGTNLVRRFTGFTALRSSSYSAPNQFSFATNRKSVHNQQYRTLDNIRHKKSKLSFKDKYRYYHSELTGLISNDPHMDCRTKMLDSDAIYSSRLWKDS
jgi:hypothetical protein